MDNLSWSVIGLPLLAGLLVASTHVPLGREVLRRGIIFIDLAVAQIAGLGVIAADQFGIAQQPWAVQLAAGATALVGALALYAAERRFDNSLEALIGSAFILAASGALLLLAGNPHGAEHMKDILSGQLLWVSVGQLWPTLLLYLLVLALWFGPARRTRIGFYLLFAVAVTASVQLVGVYLVFATLILPALATRSLSTAPGLGAGWLIAGCGYGGGLLLSLHTDLPSGPLVVWTLAGMALLSGALLGRRGRLGRTDPVRAAPHCAGDRTRNERA